MPTTPPPPGSQLGLWTPPEADLEADRADLEDGQEQLEPCAWARGVALDPKHRPQRWDKPSTTVRRAWCRSPQEAHLLDLDNWRYRRLTVEEIAILQGFDPSWVALPQLSRWDRVAALGDAVPPPLARVVVGALRQRTELLPATVLEICAGIGGLASAATDLEHLALVEHSAVACEILRHDKPWSPGRVLQLDVRQLPVEGYRDRVGLLCGGPPCQPWSNAGERAGVEDERDLLGWVHELVAAIRPAAFLFENVPGLLGPSLRPYFERILSGLRAPAAGLRYGVAAGVLNAANHGVPQTRRRVFVMGLRGAPSARVHDIFDDIYHSATHRDPRLPSWGRAPWQTLGQALGHLPDPGGWRRWVDVRAQPPT